MIQFTVAVGTALLFTSVMTAPSKDSDFTNDLNYGQPYVRVEYSNGCYPGVSYMQPVKEQRNNNLLDDAIKIHVAGTIKSKISRLSRVEAVLF